MIYEKVQSVGTLHFNVRQHLWTGFKRGRRFTRHGKLQAGGQGIGLFYEPKISKKLTLDLCGGVVGGYSISEDYFEYDF